MKFDFANEATRKMYFSLREAESTGQLDLARLNFAAIQLAGGMSARHESQIQQLAQLLERAIAPSVENDIDFVNLALAVDTAVETTGWAVPAELRTTRVIWMRFNGGDYDGLHFPLDGCADANELPKRFGIPVSEFHMRGMQRERVTVDDLRAGLPPDRVAVYELEQTDEEGGDYRFLMYDQVGGRNT